VENCCGESNIRQGLGLGKILLNGAQGMVKLQALVSTIILHSSVDLNRFF
jgi:hypothetical protein